MSIAPVPLELQSRSLSASASSSASLSIGDRGAMAPTNVPILWTKQAARWETDEAGDGERCCHIPWSSSWLSSSSEPSLEMGSGSMPVALLGKKRHPKVEGGIRVKAYQRESRAWV